MCCQHWIIILILTHGKTGSLLQALPNQRLPRLSQANYIVIVQKSSCPMALSIIISEIIRFRSSATTVERKTNLMKKKHRVTVASALLQRCFSVASALLQKQRRPVRLKPTLQPPFHTCGELPRRWSSCQPTSNRCSSPRRPCARCRKYRCFRVRALPL